MFKEYLLLLLLKYFLKIIVFFLKIYLKTRNKLVLKTYKI
jgi:hypothetical protein